VSAIPSSRPLPIALPRGSAAAARSHATNATLSEREELTDTVIRLRVRPDDGVPAFHPGQYFALGIWVGDRLIQRPYSTTSAPGGAAELEFLVRMVASGELTPRLWTLRAGTRFHIGRPKGLFTLLPGDQRTHVFIAGGTGVAPFISMIEFLSGRSVPPRMVLLHSTANAAEHAHAVRLAALPAVTHVPAISRPTTPENAGWRGAVGRVDTVLPAVWMRLRLDPTNTVAYLCGSPGLLETGVHLLVERGLGYDAIRREEFWTAATRSCQLDSRP
jgi:ferredoxin-NADP reductase